MKTRVSDYIADWLVRHDITDCFLVNGGGAMYLDDSLGHHPGMHCLYQHHEQACAMAAEGYARVENRMAVVCVTTGPGATNAITGVAGAWMDSIPMLVLSGQARYATTVYASGLNLRTRGVQEFDITGSVGNMTKYCELVRDPKDIRKCLEKAFFLAKEGRPGPCWLDIPLDVQSAQIEPEELEPFERAADAAEPPIVDFEGIIQKLLEAERPLIYLGNGVRLSGASDEARKLIEAWRVPVVNGMGSVDAVETDYPYYVGRNGTTGDRAGNFAVQTCDFLLSLGSRQSFFQTGFYYEHWAPYAFKILNDIDSQELLKDSLHADMTVCCDAGYLIRQLLQRTADRTLPDFSGWLEKCLQWKKDYPVVQERHYASDKVNLYAFYDTMTRQMPREADLAVSVGTSRVAGSQTAYLKKGQRFYTNPSMAAMGFDLPAAIGICIGNRRKKTILVTGEGSFQMNLQELQTIWHHQLPILVFVMNNQGYHSIRMTQRSFFGEDLVGVGEDSHDLSFPDLSKLIPAYGIPFRRVSSIQELREALPALFSQEGPCVCEVMLDITQVTEPKVASRVDKDGHIVSGTLENMAPFLEEEEVDRIFESVGIHRNR